MTHGSVGRTFVIDYHGNCRSAATPWAGVIEDCEVGGCPAVVAQWQSTGRSIQRCPGFDFR